MNKKNFMFIKKLIKFGARNISWLLFHRELKTLGKYKNEHIGETCYIFGSGPSIKYLDLTDYQDNIGIASNWLVFHKDFDKLNIKFITEIDPFSLSPFFNSIFKNKKMNNQFKHQFTRYFLQRVCKSNSILLTNITNLGIKIYTEFDNKKIIFVNDGFPFKSYNNHNNIRCLSKQSQYMDGTLKFQINLAIFLGFKNAILIGHDYISNNNFAGHWYEKGIIKQNIDINNWNKEFLVETSKYIKLKFLTIDLTSKTKDLNFIYPNKSIKYRENNEILSSRHLKYLSFVKQYNIY